MSSDSSRVLAGHRHPILRQLACLDTDMGGWMTDAVFQEVFGKAELQEGVLEKWIRLGLVQRSEKDSAIQWRIPYRGPYDDCERVFLVIAKEPGVLGRQITRRLAVQDSSILSDTPRRLAVGVEFLAAFAVWIDHQADSINFITKQGEHVGYPIVLEYR